uniref:PKS_ER domain-containing protein n=1 Tax=Trichuris muris TaxID=70415 RepID=A0A5S6QY55_TRIMR
MVFEPFKRFLVSALTKSCKSVGRSGLVSDVVRYYKAVRVHQLGQDAVTEEVEANPQIGKHELLVNVRCAGVNNADLLMVRGLHHHQPALPFTPGFELAGKVTAVGSDVTRFKVGDRVLALKTESLGAFAAVCVVNEKETFLLPHSVDYETACCLPAAYGSAYLALSQERDLQSATVLVITNQGATGLAAVDLALNVFCSKTIAACDTEAKCSTVRPFGVKSTIEYADENLTNLVAKATENKGVDAVVDTVGLLYPALDCLKPGGRYISLGFSNCQIPEINMQQIVKRQVSIKGVWFGGYAQHDPDGAAAIIQKILKMQDEEYINPLVGARFKLEQINHALKCLAERRLIGKVIVTVA